MCYNILPHAHRVKYLILILEHHSFVYINNRNTKAVWRQVEAVGFMAEVFSIPYVVARKVNPCLSSTNIA